MLSIIHIAGRAFAVPALDEAVLKRIHDDWDAEDSDGMLLFLDTWVKLLTFDTAKQLIVDFNLQDELGPPDEIEQRYAYVEDAFYAIEEALNKTVVKKINDESSIAKSGGPEYSAGRKDLNFGLLFHASRDALEDLRKRFPAAIKEDVPDKTDDEQLAEEILKAGDEVARSAATYSVNPISVPECLQRAVNLIKSVDFGHPGDAGIASLENAYDMLAECGIVNNSLKLSIRHYLTDRKLSRELVYGTDSGASIGALNELVEMMNSPVPTTLNTVGSMDIPKSIVFRGAVYRVIEDVTPMAHYAYDLPDKMDGVRPCTPKDMDDKKPAGEQVWCTFDSHGKLRARYKNKTKALRYKVMMINRYWSSGKGKKRKDRPSNK